MSKQFSKETIERLKAIEADMARKGREAMKQIRK